MTEGVVRGWWEALYDVITMRQPLGTFERIVQLVVTARWIAFSFAPESGTGGVFHWTGGGGGREPPWYCTGTDQRKTTTSNGTGITPGQWKTPDTR